MPSFDSIYKKPNLYYGYAPSPYLEILIKRENPAKGHALDVGCGDGRNSIFLAENGFQVVAIDNSKEAILKLGSYARQKELSIEAVLADVTEYEYEVSKYSIIVANTIIDHLEKDQGNNLVTKLKHALMNGGIIFISAFTVDDPGNKKAATQSETAQFVKRYFEHGELRNMLSDLTLMRYHEEDFRDTNHGKPHYHSVARIIARLE